MQSEDFDNKLREAADKHHPDYDEKAWSKMEKLLDRHLPQTRDGRRRIIFFLFLFLFSGGGLWFFISQLREGKRNIVQTEQTIQKPVTADSDEPIVAGKEKKVRDEASDVNSTKKNMDDETNNSPSAPVQVITRRDKKTVDTRAGNKESALSITLPPVTNKKRNNQKSDQLVNDQSGKLKQDIYLPNDQQDKNSVEPSKPNTRKAVNSENAVVKKNEPAKADSSTSIIGPDKKITGTQEVTEKKDDMSATKMDVAKKTNHKGKKSNSFFISLSAGPDVSGAGASGFGKIKLLAGAGFGYTFKDRWTIRTGFYTGSKVYTTTPDKYKPSVPPQNPYYLYEIAANCKVYEIPLSLAYNFNPLKKSNLFAAAGLSSFIMKKEVYDYQYKYPGGQSWTYTHTEDNKNKHYFSVLALSGGYEHIINKTFSIMAEPYIKIPLTGIGYGKVKLTSAGMAVSVKIKPFQ